MFKYKSPLSRLLEGAGKAKETEEEVSPAPEAEAAEPIADFNALRQALAGGNMPSESYEDAEELIPEERMPDFDEGNAEPDQAEAAEEAVEPEVSDIAEETANDDEVEQVVTLHLSTPENKEPEGEPVQVETAETVEETAPEPVAETPEPVLDDTPAAQPAAVQPEQPAAQAEDRRARVKTTFLGFERPDTHVQDLMETAPAAKAEATQESFPVGWLVITSGPGRGASVILTEGLMQIGRNDDQGIQLDFGDTGISRSNHAVIAYDPEDRKCYLGHGGKANLVRLNGKPVLSTVPLNSGDMIRISETSMRFVAFCDDGFDWRDA